MAKPMPRLAPVTTAVVPVRSNRPLMRCTAARRRGSSSPGRPRGRRTRRRGLDSGTISVISSVGRDAAASSSSTARLEVRRAGRRARRGCAARARTRAAGRSRGASDGWRPRRSCRAPWRARSRRARPRRRRRPRTRRRRRRRPSTPRPRRPDRSSRGSSVVNPSASICAPALGVELDDDDLAAELAGDGGDEHADRAAADDDRPSRPAASSGAAHVVHGDGDRLDERGVVEAQAGGQATSDLAGHVPELLQRAGGVDADEVQVLADVRVAGEAGGAGAVPVERHHGDRVAGRPAGHAGADGVDRAAHLVAEDQRRASTRASMLPCRMCRSVPHRPVYATRDLHLVRPREARAPRCRC